MLRLKFQEEHQQIAAFLHSIDQMAELQKRIFQIVTKAAEMQVKQQLPPASRKADKKLKMGENTKSLINVKKERQATTTHMQA